MSRRIVQIAAVDASYDEGNGPSLFALDNNGVAWVMWGPRCQWVRLPALPSFENRTAAAAPAPLDLERDA